MASEREITEKQERVRKFLRARGLDALLLKRQANFSWLTGGGLNLVGITTELGAASLLVTEKAKYAISNNIEAPRLLAEENLASQGFEVLSYPWYEDREADLVQQIVGTGRIGADFPFPDSVLVAQEVARLRYSLTADEVSRYRWLGEKVSVALETTMLAAKRGEKEVEVIGRLLSALWKDRIDAVTLMGAADERISLFRHPIPTEKKVERILMVSVNARKWGLIVSLTRFVHFGRIPADLRERYEANVSIDCAFMAATRPGVPARDVLRKGIEAYARHGYPEEWKNHHQGGSIGYTGRDYRVTGHTPDVVEANQAFTWNPSLRGTKSEDTILAAPEGVEMITRPILYPTLAVEESGMSFVRPAILEAG